MINTIPTKKEETIAQAAQLIDGLETHETELNIKQNTKEVIIAALAAATNAKTLYDTAMTAKTVLVTALNAADENVKAFIGVARSVLLFFIGSLWSEAWMSTGFPDQSTQVPTTRSAREVLLAQLKAYFTANPTQEVSVLNVTAAFAAMLETALSDARAAYTEALADCRTKRLARDEAFTTLRKRMRGLITELETVLDANDSRWLAFGLNLPGAVATPDVPEHLLATLVGPTAAALKWNAAARADYYRIWMKVLGVDGDFIAMGSPADLDFTIEGLPPGSTIEFAITAINDGGESALSEKVTLVTHA